MKKLALSIVVTASLVLAGSSIAFGALRIETGGSVFASQRDSSLIVDRGGSPRLVYVNERLYPDDFVGQQLGPLPRTTHEDERTVAAEPYRTSGVEANGWCDVECYVDLAHSAAAQGGAQFGTAPDDTFCIGGICFGQ